MAVLKKGSSGPEVETLQGELNRLGYSPGPIDGDFGSKTRSAVVAFQKRHDLDPDGIVGPKTRKAINAALRQFVSDGGSSRGTTPIVDEVNDNLQINRSLRLNNGEYYKAKHRKDLIVLHHTAGGSARSTINWWNQSPQHIATAFIIERDGTIYEVFDPEYWAYHLGIKGTNGAVDRRSIGIEIACEGGLKESGGKLYKFDRVQSSSEFTAPHYAHTAPWRGYRSYAAYTPEQVTSAINLTDHLLEQFNIPRKTPTKHFDFDKRLYGFKGVVGHHHLRSDKSDLHPGFEWGRLVRDCGLERV